MEEALGCEVEEIQASDYNAIIEALRTDKADMAYLGALSVALAEERAGAEPIVMKAEDGDPEKAVYHSVLVANASNDEINSIEDIKGKTMGLRGPRFHFGKSGTCNGHHPCISGRGTKF